MRLEIVMGFEYKEYYNQNSFLDMYLAIDRNCKMHGCTISLNKKREMD